MCKANGRENWSSRKPHRHSKNRQTAALGLFLFWNWTDKRQESEIKHSFSPTSLGLQQRSLGVIIFKGNSIFSPHLTASSDTACLASRQKQHFVGLSTSFFFCKEQKNKESWSSEQCVFVLKLTQENEGKYCFGPGTYYCRKQWKEFLWDFQRKKTISTEDIPAAYNY